MAEILGHQNIIDYFKKIVAEDRIPHALLMVGPEGSGKLSLALHFAQMIQCQDLKDGNSCGLCHACKNMEAYVHPDLHFAFPVVKLEGTKRDETTSLDFINEWRAFLKNDLYGNLSDWLMSINASDTNANINVAECNRIIKNLGLKSYEGKYKIQIIWNAESLAKEGNRLLKLIEEPSDDTIIILILNNQDAILNTIKSRCQILTVSPYSDDEIMAHLQSKFDLKSNELSEITYLSSGDIRKAEELAANKQMNFSEDMLNWFRLAYKADPEELLDWTLYLNSKGKGEIKTFMSYSLHFLREYLLGMNLNETENLRLSNEEKSVILKMKNIINRSKTERLEKVFSKNYGHINRNVSMKIMLMAMSLEINEILRSEVNKFVH